ncbi:maleylpyruvate isomerase family mycothiol-dependent enzyme [Spirillospora sp. CA-294931]|uniref:maleylpyruvate isomerase family mycothiol-dependent enzyme n=1 Tax=Spirillospora sp. CA-294931 TaxID=3240042 RepID=UPI003D8A90CB
MSEVGWLGPVIDVRPLFGPQQEAFVALLRGLGSSEWELPVVPGWTVRDMAAHVLGDHVGRLSMLRDGFHGMGPREGEPFPEFIDRINDEWVVAARRISPELLVGLLSDIGDQVVEFWQTVDPHALDASVSWAGPEAHPIWLDAARDFSEYWTHHQQICEATGRAGLMEPRFVGPVLDTFLRALPHTLREVNAPEGTTLQVVVTGPGEGEWACTRGGERWELRRAAEPEAAARIEFDADTLWRLCTRGITPAQAADRVRVSGDEGLAAAALQIVSIIWSG